ncbi:hypothetical protein HYH03_015976 [Edaphochlamys debaryana]|uniref:Uncharacterized protein n=1 Tax=Edaphochlamys debaryana TaxID=47281 RepID=A0A835XL77_9CHLO|nr:hypothetical protein HYH03_015976 [Edaphochlamys debaryana]|eukprot:KAG2485302.1 hypothetical protein HYH03_015976 [Edaphochlamys debaryana]
MAPVAKVLGAGGLLAGLLAALSRLTRRKRKAPPQPAASEEGPSTSAAAQEGPRLRYPTAARTSFVLSRTLGLDGGRSSDVSCSAPGAASSSGGLLSRVLGRPSESLESGVSVSGETAASSTAGGGEEYDSSEEQDTAEGSPESRTSGYGKSDRARLVDMWIESALLVSRDLRLDKRHFDRTTRQNLKKMRPASAQLILSDIADRSWEGILDIAKEVHRLVSHAKAQDKFASSSASAGPGPNSSSGPGLQPTGGAGVGGGGGGGGGGVGVMGIVGPAGSSVGQAQAGPGSWGGASVGSGGGSVSRPGSGLLPGPGSTQGGVGAMGSGGGLGTGAGAGPGQAAVGGVSVTALLASGGRSGGGAAAVL